MSNFEPPRGEPSRPVLTHPRRRPRTLLWITLGVALIVVLVVLYMHHRRSMAAESGADATGGPSARGGRGPGGPGGGRRGGPGQASMVTPVGTATAKIADVPVILDGLGTVVPRANVTVQSRVAGQLMSVPYKEGQQVKAGDVLAVVDPRPYLAALKSAQGNLLRDQALLADAKLDLQRYKTLVQQESIATQQLDTQAALVQQDEGTVKSDQGAVDTARINLIYTKVTAPVSGRVGLRPVDIGNVVTTTETNGVALITEQQPIDVIFTIPQDDIAAVAAPMRAGTVIPVDAYDRASKNKLASGSLLTVDNTIDVTTGTVKLKASFANTDEALFPNQFVNIQMLVNTLKSAITIPTSGVQRGSQGIYAYVVKPDNTVTVRPITIIVTNGDTVAIGSGVAAGEVVVVDGADKLREGAQVEPVDRSNPNTAAGVVAVGAPNQQSGQNSQRAGHHHHRDATSSGDSAQSQSSAR